MRRGVAGVLQPEELQEALNKEFKQEAFSLDSRLETTDSIDLSPENSSWAPQRAQIEKPETPSTHESGIEHAGQMKAKFEGVSELQKTHWQKHGEHLSRYEEFAVQMKEFNDRLTSLETKNDSQFKNIIAQREALTKRRDEYDHALEAAVGRVSL